MIVLALDTASDRLLAGLANEGSVLAEFTGDPDRSHSEKIISVLDSLLKSADIQPSKIDALAVTTGPGSFTGLRVGIATVLGLSQAWGKPIFGVESVPLARMYFESKNQQPVIVSHCRGDQFYVSPTGDNIEILPVESIIEKFADRQFGGFGTEQLLDLASKQDRELKRVHPSIWTGGEMATLICRNLDNLKPLDPDNLNVNYVLKSQPEQRRDSAKTSLEVGDLTRGDLQHVMQIEREAFSDPWHEENFVADIENPHIITLVARFEGVCIGYLSCMAMDDCGYVANVAVDYDHRSKGAGRALMDELQKRLKERKINEIVLDVRVSNSRAIGFYEKYGFVVLTRRKGFYTTPPEDSFTMLKTLED